MAGDGVTNAVSLVLAPHFSAMSVARYQQKVADGLDLYRARIHFEHVPSYHDAPGLVEAFAARVDDGVSRWPEGERAGVHVVFSAHSLPQRVFASGDPYGDQCLETARLVAARAGLPDERWSWAYQSAGRTPEPWAGPGTPEPWAGPDLGEGFGGYAEATRRVASTKLTSCHRRSTGLARSGRSVQPTSTGWATSTTPRTGQRSSSAWVGQLDSIGRSVRVSTTAIHRPGRERRARRDRPRRSLRRRVRGR